MKVCRAPDALFAQFRYLATFQELDFLRPLNLSIVTVYHKVASTGDNKYREKRGSA